MKTTERQIKNKSRKDEVLKRSSGKRIDQLTFYEGMKTFYYVGNNAFCSKMILWHSRFIPVTYPTRIRN